MNLLRSKKGFTLVEIIVVLVIIAILAAISLPALTGYISDAKDKSAISEARTVMVATQTIASELTGLGGHTIAEIKAYIEGNGGSGKPTITGYTKTITSLTGLKGSQIGTLTDLVLDPAGSGAVVSFTYERGGKKVYLYDGTLNLTAKT